MHQRAELNTCAGRTQCTTEQDPKNKGRTSCTRGQNPMHQRGAHTSLSYHHKGRTRPICSATQSGNVKKSMQPKNVAPTASPADRTRFLTPAHHHKPPLIRAVHCLGKGSAHYLRLYWDIPNPNTKVENSSRPQLNVHWLIHTFDWKSLHAVIDHLSVIPLLLPS